LIRREFNAKLSVVTWAGCCESWGYHRSVRCASLPTESRTVEQWKSEVYRPSALRLRVGRPSTSVMRRGYALTSMPAPPGHQSGRLRSTHTGTAIRSTYLCTERAGLCVLTTGKFESATFINFCKRLMHDTVARYFSLSTAILSPVQSS